MAATEGETMIAGITVVDTRSGDLARNMMVSLSNGCICGISPSMEADHGSGSVDGRGKYLVPGFLDMHAHVLEEEHPEDALQLMLAHGITGWRQMSGSSKLLARRKQGKLSLGTDAPALLGMPGEILTAANAATPEQAVAEVTRQKTEGADFIKTIYVRPDVFFAALNEATGRGLPYVGHLSPGVNAVRAAEAGMRSIEHLGPVDLQLISCSSREWLIRVAQALHRSAVPKKHMAESMKTAAANPIVFRLQRDAAALRKTQHLLDSFSERKAEQLARSIASNNTWQVPTLIRNETMQFGDDPRFTEGPDLRYIRHSKRRFWNSVVGQFASSVDGAGRKTLQQEMDLELKLVKMFNDAGVEMLTGTDHGGALVVPGVALHKEFDLLAQAGLSALRVLQMTTLDGARFLGRESEMGTVDIGKKADLVLLERNPLESVANLHSIVGVVRDGRYYPKQALDAMKERLAERVATNAPSNPSNAPSDGLRPEQAGP